MINTLRTTVVVGNPRTGSRTLAAARLLAASLVGHEPDQIIDVATLGDSLFIWGDDRVVDAVQAAAASQLLVVASPTFKGTFSGILKMFLDHVDSDTGLAGVTAVPLMLGSRINHALAAEVHLRPLLADLGATTPAPSLFLADDTWRDGPDMSSYVKRWRSTLLASASATLNGDLL